MNHQKLLAVAVIVLFSRPGFGQARSVSVPAEPSLLNLTTSWSRASTLGDLREMRTRPDHIELRGGAGTGHPKHKRSSCAGPTVIGRRSLLESSDARSRFQRRLATQRRRRPCAVTPPKRGASAGCQSLTQARARESLRRIRSSCSRSLFRSRKSRRRGRRRLAQGVLQLPATREAQSDDGRQRHVHDRIAPRRRVPRRRNRRPRATGGGGRYAGQTGVRGRSASFAASSLTV